MCIFVQFHERYKIKLQKRSSVTLKAQKNEQENLLV